MIIFNHCYRDPPDSLHNQPLFYILSLNKSKGKVKKYISRTQRGLLNLKIFDWWGLNDPWHGWENGRWVFISLFRGWFNQILGLPQALNTTKKIKYGEDLNLIAKIVIKYYSIDKEALIKRKPNSVSPDTQIIILKDILPYKLRGAKQCQSLNLDASNAGTCLKNCFWIQMKRRIWLAPSANPDLLSVWSAGPAMS